MTQSERLSGRAIQDDASSSPLDRITERLTRHVAGHSSRRSVLGRLGAWVTFGAVVPLLPVERASAAASPHKAEPEKSGTHAPSTLCCQAQTTDPTACDYWRYCAIDGFLCASCGGGVHSCPPGTRPSPSHGSARASTRVTVSPTSWPIVIAVGRMPAASRPVLARMVISPAIVPRPITTSSGASVRVRSSITVQHPSLSETRHDQTPPLSRQPARSAFRHGQRRPCRRRSGRLHDQLQRLPPGGRRRVSRSVSASCRTGWQNCRNARRQNLHRRCFA